ncbi:UDP-glucose 4-epimerase GalE [Mariprofundus ferrooxydans]|uniref:UDP-glucose 4-epimerase GalE n=1 Tax=Mariprofundus ferrooxydans TaxID=314344 RepID=UPI00197E3450|nr:UDP-glucose 4-epimerase GalE [Mariprofundus ferrooxydans]
MSYVLVTGGAGYIGSHACKALAKAGYTPVVFDNLVYGHEWAVQWGPFERGDLADETRLNEVFARYDFAAVMHFAAYAYVGESVGEPGKYYRNNVAGTLNLLDAMRRHGVNKIVFSSTCATYGEAEVIPIPETHAQQPINPYGASKLMVERILKDYDSAYGLRFVALRYFNAAGADSDGEIGEDHEPETHLIPLVLDAAAGVRDSIMINGTDYDTPDGTCIRDYIHVTDLANAHLLALQALLRGEQSRAYNLGNGKGYSIRELIEVAASVTGKEIAVQYGPRRPGDAPALAGDAKVISRELGWQPTLGALETIIETAWKWHMKKLKVSSEKVES